MTDRREAGALRVERLSKTFPGVTALKGVSFSVGNGEVHALLGHNGSGKSTLVKVLAGSERADAGSAASLEGVEFDLDSARRPSGMRFVHQDLGVVLELNAVDNIALTLGYERGRGGRVDWRRQRERTERMLRRFEVEVDLEAPLGALSPLQRTTIAIVRALEGIEPGRGLLVLDEPTASLSVTDARRLFTMIREVSESGTAVLYVSHRLDEIFEIADRLTILREGSVVAEGNVAEYDLKSLAGAIAGEAVEETEGAAEHADAAVALRAAELRSTHLRGVDLTLRDGEVVGVAGLLGSGREDLPYALDGALEEPLEGSLEVGGRPVGSFSVKDARQAGIVLVPADRATESVVPEFTVRQNLTLSVLGALRRRGFLKRRLERDHAADWLDALRVTEGASERPIETLSGGNQQKVIVGRSLGTHPRVLLLAEPTAGIDVGARDALYRLIVEQAESGLGVLLASSDFEDFSICSRVLVFRHGRVVGELDGRTAGAAALLRAVEGVGANGEAAA